MMDKEALYTEGCGGPAALLLGQSEGQVGHTKLASFSLLPEVRRFIDTLEPEPGCKYILVNAMGAGEYWGCNANSDWFGEQALVHTPPGWTGDPAIDRGLSKYLTYGYPTFYQAHFYCHHRNQNPAKRLGEVELAAWNDRMKRVELIGKIHDDRCREHGGAGFLGRLESGDYPAVSMGARVKWDACSICTDWPVLFAALKTFDPKKHADPGLAVLEVHEKLRREKGIKDGEEGGIKGVGRTRKEYCSCMKTRARQIDPATGKQVFVYNFFPRFFDISMVLVGADKTAKTMMHLSKGMTKKASYIEQPGSKIAGAISDQVDRYMRAGGANLDEAIKNQDRAAAHLAPPVALHDQETRKLAEAKSAEKKQAKVLKKAEMDKRLDAENVKNIPATARGELDLPRDILGSMAQHPLGEALGTAGSLGIVLRPREYQRIVLIQMGVAPLADQLDKERICFGYAPPSAPPEMGFSETLARVLGPLMSQRSGYAEPLRSRVTMVFSPKMAAARATSLPSDLLSKLASDYQGYRRALLLSLPSAQEHLAKTAEAHLQKIASLDPSDLFTPLSYAYFRLAFQDEVAPTMTALVRG